MTRIWLIGMSGTGKTTAGRRAAEILDVGFTDTDELVMGRSGRTIAELWDERGEQSFRALETAVITETAEVTGVVAGGGGAILDPVCREVIGRSDHVVWLEAPAEVIARRIEAEGRPLFAGGLGLARTAAEILRQRFEIYQGLATHRIDTTTLDTEGVAREIAGLWRG